MKEFHSERISTKQETGPATARSQRPFATAGLGRAAATGPRALEVSHGDTMCATPPSGPDMDELVPVPQPDATVLMKRRGDLDFDDISARARANVNGEKPPSPSIKEQRAKRELDRHRANLERLRNWARTSPVK